MASGPMTTRQQLLDADWHGQLADQAIGQVRAHMTWGDSLRMSQELRRLQEANPSADPWRVM